MSADEKISFSITSLAAALDLSVDSVQKAIKNGDLVPRYFGTKPLITREEADRWLSTLPEEKPVKV